MCAHVGVVRNGAGLRHALAEIARLERDFAREPQLRNMATAALLIAAAALARTESRGGHYRSDYPNADPRRRSAPSSRSMKRARSRAPPSRTHRSG